MEHRPSVDNEIAIQIDLGVATTPQTFEYHLAFSGEATIDLDNDDSTATGNSYATSYNAGSGEVIAVADSDATIRNVVGDIQELRIAIANPVAGDSLAVNLDALPPDVQVKSQSETEVVLESTTIPQTEEVFDAALGAVGFSTTSFDTTERSLEFAVTNELGQEGRASAGAIIIVPDTDQDGVVDNIDLDDDNDGILDADEGLGLSSGQFAHQNFKRFDTDGCLLYTSPSPRDS